MIVIDANAALAVSMGLEAGNAMELLRDGHEKIIAPTLIHAEVSHALSKYIKGGYIDADQAIDCGRDALLLVDEFASDEDLWVEATTESVRLGHPSYDLFYLILARRECATLFTLDRKLQRLCAECGVNCIESIDF